MEDSDWVSLTLLWIVILIVTLALIQVKLTDVADPATTVNEKIVNAKLNQVREDLEGVTHKVYFDIQNNGSPAENFRDQITIRRRITVSRSINFFFSDSPASVALGWHMEPITHGDYLQTMKDNIGARLPLFTPEQKEEFSKCGKCKNGKIGIVQIPMWFEPYDKKSSSNAPEEIVKRAMDFTLGCDKSRWVQD